MVRSSTENRTRLFSHASRAIPNRLMMIHDIWMIAEDRLNSSIRLSKTRLAAHRLSTA